MPLGTIKPPPRPKPVVDMSGILDRRREQKPPNPPKKKKKERKERNMPPQSEYEFNKQFHQTFYPGTNIRDMPYRIPARMKRGASWEKMHGQAVKLRQRARYSYRGKP